VTQWTFLVTDLTTATVVDAQSPFTDVVFTDQLCGGGGSFQGVVPAGHKSWSQQLSNDGLRRVIWPCRDGIPQGAYLMTGAQWDTSKTVRSIKGERLDSLLKDRAITKTLTFSVLTDQNDIFRDILRFAIGRSTIFTQPLADQTNMLPQAAIPWIVTDGAQSGRTHVRQETPGNLDDGYPAAARKNVAQMLANLTDLDNGSEYRWLYRLNPSTGLPEMVLDMAASSHKVGTAEDFPARLTFDFPGGNVKSAAYGFDANTMVTRAHVVGQRQDNTTPIGTATYAALWAQGYPLVDKVVSEGSVQSQSVLDGKAIGSLCATTSAWSLTLDGTRRPSFGSYGLGDWVTLRVQQMGASRIDNSVRITGWSVKVDDSGASETVTPTLQAGAWAT
jgi:hypothetical protein